MITEQDIDRIIEMDNNLQQAMEHKVSRLERENRNLRGEVLSLRHGIEGIIETCRDILQLG
jgi:hypothetical protein